MDVLRNLDWTETLNQLASFATSAQAKSALKATDVLPSAHEAERQFLEIEEAQSLLNTGLRPFMESLDFYSLWYERLKRSAVLKTVELKDVRKFCMEVIAMKELVHDFRTPWCQQTFYQLMDAMKPLSAIDQLMTPSGDIRTDASETLHRLYCDRLELERQIRVSLEKLVRRHEMESLLQDKFVTNREGRWVLPIKSGMQHRIEGIIHDASQTKQTVFMEPEVVVQLNNQLREVNIRIDEEIERLLRELSHYLETLIEAFEQSRAALLTADQRFAQAQLANQIQGEKPTFTQDELHFTAVRHPLLVMAKGEEEIISNAVELRKGRRILLLSGPNAGGKTVLLKSLGLAAHMARCGLLITAGPRARLPFFKKIFISVGDAQSVDQHMSTFAAHLKTLTEATHAQGTDNLILVDEICGSTDPEEGSALARSFILHYAQSDAYGIITSHLGPLKEGWDASSGVITGSMDFNDQMSRPTYHLIMGVHGRSMALKTARKVGVPDAIVDRALDFISPEARARETRLAEIEGYKQEVLQLKNQLQLEVKQAQDHRNRYIELVERFKKDREQWLKRSIQIAENQIDQILQDLKRSQTVPLNKEMVKAKLPQVVKSAPKPQIHTVEDFAKAYPPGSVVFVTSLNQDGVVQGTPNGKGEIPILSQSMRVTIHWSHLQPPRVHANPTAQLTRRSGVVTSFVPNEDRTVDIRGRTVEEALQELELQLDRAAQNHEDRIKIIHGHGTEALKRAVRSYLSRSVYVQKWKAAGPENGGDGVTWAELST